MEKVCLLNSATTVKIKAIIIAMKKKRCPFYKTNDKNCLISRFLVTFLGWPKTNRDYNRFFFSVRYWLELTISNRRVSLDYHVSRGLYKIFFALLYFMVRWFLCVIPTQHFIFTAPLYSKSLQYIWNGSTMHHTLFSPATHP
jgi:hypothetical protein